MKVNPELQRNIWLELSTHRLLVTPLALGSLFLLIYLASQPVYASPLKNAALIIFYLLTILMGVRNASESVMQEIKDKTWDAQRMSSLSPWSMTWGKLLGSTAFSWYAATYCIVIYLIAAQNSDPQRSVKTIIILILLAVVAQTIALLGSLLLIRRRRSYDRSALTSLMVLGIIVTTPIIFYIDDIYPISWYGQQYSVIDFTLLSLVLFTPWVIVAAYRMMRQELQFTNSPLVWLLFLFFSFYYSVGHINNANLSQSQWYTNSAVTVFTVTIALSYVMLLVEPKNPVTLRRLMFAIQHRHWKNVWTNLPCWLVTYLLLLFLCIFLLAGDFSSVKEAAKPHYSPMLFINLGLFLGRDILIVIYFNLSKSQKHNDATALFYLLLLYLLIPFLLETLGLNSILDILLPLNPQFPVISTASALIQITIMLFFVRVRWQQSFNFKTSSD